MRIDANTIDSIAYENTDELPEFPDDKYSRLDLKLVVDGVIVDVEMQRSDEKNFVDRSLYYWSKMFGSAIVKGQNYNELPKTIVISFLDFVLFDWDEYVSECALTDVLHNRKVTDKLGIYFLELPKVKETNDKLALWLKFLRAETLEELDTIESKGDTDMSQAVKVIRQMNEDNLMRERARMREEAVIERVSGFAFARKKGIEEGLEKGKAIGIEKGKAIGIEKGKVEIVQELLKLNMPIDTIVAVSKLPIETIKGLLN
jgi:predicted transposase/invertase (TIGR01784 family)